MIARLGIRGLGVISAADLEFSSGMVVFTGETGAGKTMLVSALGLILGDRADTDLVFGERADLDATLIVPPHGEASALITAAGGVLDPDASVVVTRTVTSGGRASRATLGGILVPVARLAEVGALVAQRHSQSDQLRLRRPRRQREALDAFGGTHLAERRSKYEGHYLAFTAASARLQELTEGAEQSAAVTERLQDGLSEVEAFAPVPGEEVSLDRAIERLGNAESVREALTGALTALGGVDDDTPGTAVAAAEQAQQALARVVGDPEFAVISGQIAAAREQLLDATAALVSASGALDVDPGALERLHQRKAGFVAMSRRYGATADEMLRWADQAREQLRELGSGDDRVEAERTRIAALLPLLAGAAADLHDARSSAAVALGERVTAELVDLAMPTARFDVTVAQREDPVGLTMSDGRRLAFGPDGTDVVTFRLRPHREAPASPIGEGASGGELSRVMLALEVVLADADAPSVFVFDEVDAGIGGRAAIEVGRRLAALARRSQVLVVTHLAQVAAFADQHIVVSKDLAGQVTTTSVSDVAGADRRRELARMLSGQDESATATLHAQELLDLASSGVRP